MSPLGKRIQRLETRQGGGFHVVACPHDMTKTEQDALVEAERKRLDLSPNALVVVIRKL